MKKTSDIPLLDRPVKSSGRRVPKPCQTGNFWLFCWAAAAADPITDRAVAVIIAHNHPIGNVTSSKDDVKITRRLTSAGDTLGIKVLEYIILSHNGYYSFLESNQLNRCSDFKRIVNEKTGTLFHIRYG